MTQSLPNRDPKTLAITDGFPVRFRKIRLTLISGFFLILTWWLLAGSAFAQTESDVSEEEAASQSGQADESVADQFDFFGSQAPVDLSQLREMQKRFQELSEKVADATVNVQVGQNQGTGVIVTRDGYVMTAAHVIGGANRRATIKLANGDILRGKTLGLNRTIDSGLIKITEDGKYPYLNPGVSEELKTGQWVMAIGHPGGWDEDRGLVYRIGRILQISDTSISTDCTVVGGDSGGPLVDMDGYVIGIHSRIGAALSSNIHVPVDVFSEGWDDLTNGRDWGSGIGGSNPANEPWLGLSFKDESIELSAVIPDGPAARAGLKAGDQLLMFGTTKVSNQIRFRRLFRRLKPGQDVKIKIKRGEEELELELEVGSQADAN